jgi:hypothetical protein
MTQFILPLDISSLEISAQSVDNKENIIFDAMVTDTNKPLFNPNGKYLLEKGGRRFIILTEEYTNPDKTLVALQMKFSAIDVEERYFYIKYIKRFGTHEYLEINTCTHIGMKFNVNDVVDIQIPVKGIHLGSLVLNQMVIWAKINFPHVKFRDLSLSSVDTQDDNNMLRRNKLYSNLGYKLNGCRALGFIAKDMITNNSNFKFRIQSLDINGYVVYQPNHCFGNRLP